MRVHEHTRRNISQPISSHPCQHRVNSHFVKRIVPNSSECPLCRNSVSFGVTRSRWQCSYRWQFECMCQWPSLCRRRIGLTAIVSRVSRDDWKVPGLLAVAIVMTDCLLMCTLASVDAVIRRKECWLVHRFDCRRDSCLCVVSSAQALGTSKSRTSTWIRSMPCNTSASASRVLQCSL